MFEEASEDEGEEEEGGGAREQMACGRQVPAEQLRRLALDYPVVGVVADELHHSLPAGEPAGTATGCGDSP